MTVKAKDSLAVATFQICSTDSLEQNYSKILNMIKPLNLNEVDLCVFPENAIYISVVKNEKPPVIDFEHGFFSEIKEIAKKNKIAFHLGSAPIYKDGSLYNSTIYISESGELSFPYDKIHLFAAKVGSLEIDEGITYKSGGKLSVLEVKGWKVGLSICFDLRFPELYLEYAKKGVDLLLVPSAFFRQTGKFHWEPLLKARAIESQAYVVAPGQSGLHKSQHSDSVRKSYGHSLVIDPWGETLKEFDSDKEGVSLNILEQSKITKTRNSVFMKRKI